MPRSSTTGEGVDMPRSSEESITNKRLYNTNTFSTMNEKMIEADEKARDRQALPELTASATPPVPVPCDTLTGQPARRPNADESGDESGAYEENAQAPGVMSRVLSRVTSRSSVDPGPPPDGGWKAWSQVLVAHIVIMNTWGFINSFGTFQAYYSDTLGVSPSSISWIGSLSTFLLFFIGTPAGRLTDAGYFRIVFLAGSILLVAGAVATSFAGNSYWQLLLAQGLCMGVANGLVFCPILAVTSTYFLKRRAIALGLGACGSVTGGIAFPLIVRELLPKIGFGWTIRVIALIMLVTSVVANLLAQPRVEPRKAGPWIDWTAFTEFEYTFYAAGSFFCFWGVYFAFFYIAAFSREALDEPLSYTSSLNFLLLLNGVGALGRTIPSILADRFGAVNVLVPTSAIAALLVYCWIAVESPTGLYVWGVFYGIAAGGIQAIFPAGLAFLTSDLRRLGVRMGMSFTIVSFAVLSGTPIAGAIIGTAPEGNKVQGYHGAQAFAGSVLACGCCLIFAAKVVRMRKTNMGWLGKT